MSHIIIDLNKVIIAPPQIEINNKSQLAGLCMPVNTSRSRIYGQKIDLTTILLRCNNFKTKNYTLTLHENKNKTHFPS